MLEPTDANIAAVENWLSGDGMSEGNGASLDPDVYSQARYFPSLLKGLQAKLRGDDNAAYSHWKNIPRSILDEYLPRESFPPEYYKKE